MTGFFLGLYKAVLLIGYFYLSAALLFRQRVRRWIIFTAAYAVLYLIGRALFFGFAFEGVSLNFSVEAGELRGADVAVLIRLGVFLGIAAIVGIGLARDEPWSFDQMLGAVLLFVVIVTAVVVALHTAVGGRPVEWPSWISRLVR